MSITRINNLGITDGTIVNADISASAAIASTKLTGVNDAKAWVNFNGTGTVAIRASFNVSSITDNGTGDYTINFTNALTDANYSLVACCATYTAGNAPTVINIVNGGTYTTSAVRIISTYSYSTNYQDTPVIGVAILR